MPPGGTAGDAGPMTWRPRRTASSRSRTRCTPRTGSCRACPSSSLPGCRSGPRRSARCRRASRRVPFEAIAGGPPDGAGHRELADAVDALDRELLGVAHPDDHRFLRGRIATGLALPRARRRCRSATATRARRVGSDRSAVRDADLLAPVLGHLTTAVQPRGAFALWLPGRPIARSCPRSAPGSASTSSRSCSAGTGRSPTSPATCRSRPASSSERTRPPGPDHRPGAP